MFADRLGTSGWTRPSDAADVPGEVEEDDVGLVASRPIRPPKPRVRALPSVAATATSFVVTQRSQSGRGALETNEARRIAPSRFRPLQAAPGLVDGWLRPRIQLRPPGYSVFFAIGILVLSGLRAGGPTQGAVEAPLPVAE
jgi:hypothetical protein